MDIQNILRKQTDQGTNVLWDLIFSRFWCFPFYFWAGAVRRMWRFPIFLAVWPCCFPSGWPGVLVPFLPFPWLSGSLAALCFSNFPAVPASWCHFVCPVFWLAQLFDPIVFVFNLRASPAVWSCCALLFPFIPDVSYALPGLFLICHDFIPMRLLLSGTRSKSRKAPSMT